MKALGSIYLLGFYFFFWLTGFDATAQSGSQENVRPAQFMPAVFILGEYDKQYESIMPGYTTLLEACGGDMKLAYEKLMTMMREMEAYATLEKYNIKGINAWMHFFWKEDGSIEHIGFYLKPNSRNVDTEKLRAFLSGFASWYKIPVHSDKKFSHYSSFAFPMVFQLPTNPDGEKATVKTTNSNY